MVTDGQVRILMNGIEQEKSSAVDRSPLSSSKAGCPDVPGMRAGSAARWGVGQVRKFLKLRGPTVRFGPATRRVGSRRPALDAWGLLRLFVRFLSCNLAGGR